MNLAEEYRLSMYRDYGPLQSKEHVRLVRDELSGKIYVKKIMDTDRKQVFDYLKANPSHYIPVIEECLINDGQLIVIEEYIEGKSLEELISEKKLSEAECAYAAVELCRAMEPLHEAKPPVICRDLKAENIMVDSKGDLKIIDFDIARIYQEGKNRDTVLMGTAEYAAPEQYGYFQTDSRTDIFSLGVLMNYMLIQKFPVEKIAEGRMESMIRKCISMNPEDRYQSVRELREELTAEMELDRIKRDVPLEIMRNTEDVKKESCAIPGFRTRNPWKMCAAVIGYLAFIGICSGIEIKEKNGEVIPLFLLRMYQIIIFLSQIAEIFIIFNYRGVRDKIPFLNSKNAYIRVIGYIVTEIILVVAAIVICALLETIIMNL